MARVTMSTAAYRVLLRFFPREFRRAFGEDMVLLFQDRLDEAESSRERLRVWARGISDLFLHGLGDRFGRPGGKGSAQGNRGWSPHERRSREKARFAMRTEQMLNDLRYAVRTLRRSPIYTGVVVATLAVAIALNSVVFSVMNPFLLRPLPYQDPEALLHLGGLDPRSGWDGGRFSYPQFMDFQEQSRAFQGMAGYFYGTRNLSGDQAAEMVSTCWGTGNLFPLLGVQAVMGRALGPEDDHPGAPDVVLLSQGLWNRRYGGDPDIVGKTVRLDGVPHTVAGVLPREFNFPFNAVELWLPMRADPAGEARSDMGMLIVGRLAQGWTPQSAQAEITGLHQALAQAYPEEDGHYTNVVLKPLRQALNFGWDILAPAFVIMLVGVGFVLVIACVNVASLTLARLGTRVREVALRQSMGAGRGRLVRQFLVEALVLALLGGALGVGLTHACATVLAGVTPQDLYRVGEVSVDGRVLGFTALVALSTPILFALVPAWATSGRSLSESLKEGSAGGGTGRRAIRGRRFMVVAEVTLGMVLVAGTGLMIRSLNNAFALDVGFAADRILTAQVSLPASSGADPVARDARYRNLIEGLEALPSVAAVGTVSRIPLNHETSTIPFASVEGLEVPLESRPLAITSRAGPGYFEAMGIGLVAGRAFRSEDAQSDVPGVVVSRSLAERSWPGQPPVGQLLTFGGLGEERTATVLGVVEDVYYDGLQSGPRPHVYLPLLGSGQRRRFLVIRAAGESPVSALIEPVRQALFRLDPDVPASIRPQMDIVKESTALWAISSVFLGIFGLVALALAAMGVYGVVAFSVTQRTREMGLRLALGARKERILRGVVGEGIRMTAVGLALGLLGAVGTGYLLSSFLLGVGPVDPITLVGVVAIFLLVSAGAALFPARRASSVEPSEALRME